MTIVPFEYYKIEDEIAELLQPYSSFFTATALADDEAQVIKPPQSWVMVIFAGAKKTTERSAGISNHEEEISVILRISSRSLRGTKGVHTICGVLKSVLVGRRMNNGERLQFLDYGPSDQIRDEGSRMWAWDLTLTFKKLFVQQVLEDDSIGPNLSQVTFNAQFNG
jgi:hypothetical protein